MWDYIKYGALGLLGLLAVTFGLNAIGLLNMSVFGPQFEKARYTIQKESQAHRDGLQSNLNAMLNDYNAAMSRGDSTGANGILKMVSHQYSQANTAEFPPYLKDFLRTAGIN